MACQSVSHWPVIYGKASGADRAISPLCVCVCVCVCVFAVNVQAVDSLDLQQHPAASPAASSDSDSGGDGADVGGRRLGLSIHTVDELLLDNPPSPPPPAAAVSSALLVDSASTTVHGSPSPALRSILSVTPRSPTAINASATHSPRASRSRVRLSITSPRSPAVTRSRSPSPESRSRSGSASPVLTARSMYDESLSSVQTADSEQVTTHRSRSSRRRSGDSDWVTTHQSRSGRKSSRRMSETGTVSYSEDFTSARRTSLLSVKTASTQQNSLSSASHQSSSSSDNYTRRHRLVGWLAFNGAFNASYYMSRPDLRGPGPRPPTKRFVFYFSLMIDAYETTT